MVTNTSLRRGVTAVAASALLLLGMAGFVATATRAHADDLVAATPSATTIVLHNDTAQAGTDCPADGAAYWHFVLAPNNGVSAFVTIVLNLDGTAVSFTGTQIVLNGTQHDNVFVAVPAGSTLTSLEAAGSYAVYTGVEPENFNLSTVCNGTVPTTQPPTTQPPTTQPPTTQPPATVSPASEAAEVLGATQTAVSTETLPYTGSDLATRLGLAGAAMLAGGIVLVATARRRTA